MHHHRYITDMHVAPSQICTCSCTILRNTLVHATVQALSDVMYVPKLTYHSDHWQHVVIQKVAFVSILLRGEHRGRQVTENHQI